MLRTLPWPVRARTLHPSAQHAARAALDAEHGLARCRCGRRLWSRQSLASRSRSSLVFGCLRRPPRLTPFLLVVLATLRACVRALWLKTRGYERLETDAEQADEMRLKRAHDEATRMTGEKRGAESEQLQREEQLRIRKQNNSL